MGVPTDQNPTGRAATREPISRAAPDDWLRSGEYLPAFMRDFHDQKEVFKALDEVVQRRNEKDGALSYTKHVSWVAAHVYTVDVFLWVMAKHGYTLQRSRRRFKFGNIHEFTGAAMDRWRDAAAKALMQGFAKAPASAGREAAGPSRSRDAGQGPGMNPY